MTEKHLVSDFVRVTSSPSKILPGREVRAEVFSCPRCKADQPNLPEHGEFGWCPQCGLSWVAWGNSLEIYSSDDLRFGRATP